MGLSRMFAYKVFLRSATVPHESERGGPYRRYKVLLMRMRDPPRPAHVLLFETPL